MDIESRSYQRETVLLLSLLVLGLLFAVTGFATRRYHEEQKALGQESYARGEADLKAGRAKDAIDDFQTALLYSPTDPFYRLRLAQALLAANRTDEARAHLLNLREQEPENGTVNLELGRLAMRQGKVSDVLLYYHHAVYGIWENDPEDSRRQARWELCQFLLERGERAEADAELVALAADLPEDTALHDQVGELFLKAKDYSRALAQFHQALRLQRDNEVALAGAGEASFQLGRYKEAQGYLERAVKEKSGDAQAARLLEMTNLVLSIDPFERQLSPQGRRRRALRAFRQAVGRLEACAQSRGDLLETAQPHTPLEAIYTRIQKLRPNAQERALRRDPDLITLVMDVVLDAETVAASSCGAPQGLDQAILLAAQRHGSAP
jgi:tetratricopeptide (TPR) repeat protein